MKLIPTILIFLIINLASCSQNYNYPGQLEIKSYKIGDKVDTTQFNKFGDLYFPNYLDGWSIDNVDKLPDKYHGLPIAIWQMKRDSSIALTLLGNTIVNITVSFMTDGEKQKMQKLFTDKFGGEGQSKQYEETHPLQDWITYWNLITWKTNDAVAQIGNSEMRKPNQPASKEIRWNLVYSDFILENKIINDFKKTLFENKEDSLKYSNELNSYMNRENPPNNGLFIDKYDDGKIKERGKYKNSKKEGLWESWFENGQKEDSAIYDDDELIGKRLMWFSNGQLQLESYWSKSHERIGVWKRYFENGKPESITSFDDEGEFHGTLLQFYENGNKKRETHYEHGKELSDVMWNEDGKQIN